jgi:hypothetical protein
VLDAEGHDNTAVKPEQQVVGSVAQGYLIDAVGHHRKHPVVRQVIHVYKCPPLGIALYGNTQQGRQQQYTEVGSEHSYVGFWMQSKQIPGKAGVTIVLKNVKNVYHIILSFFLSIQILSSVL